MTTEMKTLVFDNLQSLELTASGAITMFKTATNHIVFRNQETINALHEWIHTLNIHKVPGENVYIACTQCRVVIRALEGFHQTTESCSHFVTKYVPTIIL